MRISDLFDDNEKMKKLIEPESILRMLLCYYNNIRDNLDKVNKFSVIPELNYVNDYIKNDFHHIEHITNKNVLVKIHKDVNYNRHRVLKHFFTTKKQKFIKIENYKYQNELKSEFDGPYLSGTYILFYHKRKNLLLSFSFTPIRHLKAKNLTNKDNIIRDLNSYIIDNVSHEVFAEYISNNMVSFIDFTEIIQPLTLTLRIDAKQYESNFYILKLLKECIDNNSTKHPFYKWMLTKKSTDNQTV